MAGCYYDTQCRVDSRVGSLGGCPMDATPPHAPPPAGNGGGTTPDSIHAPLPTIGTGAGRRQIQDAFAEPAWQLRREQAGVCRPAAYEAPASARPPRTVQPLEIPSAIPGSAAPPLRLPPVRPGATPAERRSAIEALFADLEVIPPVAEPVPRPAKRR